MGFWQTVSSLFFPPRCAACGTRLSLSFGEDVSPYFCKSCHHDLKRQMLAQCPTCFAAYCDCRCQPKILSQKGSVALRKLSPYGAESEPHAIDLLIRNMKTHPRKRVIAACVEELAPILKTELSFWNEKTPISHTVIAYLPRSRKKVLQYGFDQARELATALSKETGYPVMPLLKRVKDGKTQKTLSVTERQANLRGAFGLRGEPAGLRVVLVDDIVTTGAGMAEGVRVLIKAKAAQVICLSVAVTPKKQAKGN